VDEAANLGAPGKKLFTWSHMEKAVYLAPCG
jgi:hypothetical protein